ncbi:MAG: hypothetical protein WCT19_03775 [Candidatus Paceibacterota bacterium]
MANIQLIAGPFERNINGIFCYTKIVRVGDDFLEIMSPVDFDPGLLSSYPQAKMLKVKRARLTKDEKHCIESQLIIKHTLSS